MQKKPKFHLATELIAGLTVSFVAISLGAAFGVLSGRGAFAGILSAAVIALVTSAIGGTRIQCSGPTAPMTAVTALVVAAAYDQIPQKLPGINPDHFINIVILMCAVFLILLGLLRTGRFIRLVPNVVISGFMNGIAILIWLDQAKKLFGFGGKIAYLGDTTLNLFVAILTFVLIYLSTAVLKRFVPRVAPYLPATLVALIFASGFENLMGLHLEHVSVKIALNSWSDFVGLMQAQIPQSITLPIVSAALPFALQLALLAYLDSLLTALVMDKLTGEPTDLNRELGAQGIANALVVPFGGIGGAQATIRSVLIFKEGAVTRFAGISVGLFVIVELLLFKNYIGLIPQAVFAGVLLKVGIDVFDWNPVKLFVRGFKARQADTQHRVSIVEILFIMGTTLTTLLWNLNMAVIIFSLLFHLLKHRIEVRDLQFPEQTEGMLDED